MKTWKEVKKKSKRNKKKLAACIKELTVEWRKRWRVVGAWGWQERDQIESKRFTECVVRNCTFYNLDHFFVCLSVSVGGQDTNDNLVASRENHTRIYTQTQRYIWSLKHANECGCIHELILTDQYKTQCIYIYIYIYIYI